LCLCLGLWFWARILPEDAYGGVLARVRFGVFVCVRVFVVRVRTCMCPVVRVTPCAGVCGIMRERVCTFSAICVLRDACGRCAGCAVRGVLCVGVCVLCVV